MTGTLSEERIAAWIDGALDAREAEEVAMAVAADPEAQKIADRLRALNGLLREAYAAPLSEPVPDGIAALLREEPARVIAFPGPRRRFFQPVPLAAGLAAGLALAIGLGWLQPGGGGMERIAVGPVAADSPLHAALTGLPSGQVSPEGISPVLTVRVADGRLCREFELAEPGVEGALTFGVACLDAAARWDVAVLVEALPGEPVQDGFAPASGPGGDALAAFLEANAAQPVPAEEEGRLIGEGWEKKSSQPGE